MEGSLAFIGKYIATKLLNYGWDAVKDQFKYPPMVEAFERACEKIMAYKKMLFSVLMNSIYGDGEGST